MEMSEDNETYCSTGGIQLEGNDFQIKLLELFLKRGLDKGYDFKLATEWDDADKFDDLIFMYKNNNDKWMHRFLQAKHRKNSSQTITISDLTADSGDFSLQKYFIAYLNIMKNPLFIEKNVKVKDFILCTNVNLEATLERDNFEDLEEDDNILNVHKSDNNRAKLLKLKKGPLTEMLISRFKECSDLKILANELARCVINNEVLELRKGRITEKYQNVLAQYIFTVNNATEDNQSTSTDEPMQKRQKSNHLYVQFQSNFLNESCTDLQLLRTELYEAYLKNKTDFITVNSFWEKMKKTTLKISKKFRKESIANDTLQQLNNSLVTHENVKDFFKKLLFAVNLPNEDKLGKIIASELHVDYRGIKVDVIEGCFRAFIDKWIKNANDMKQFFNNIKENNLWGIFMQEFKKAYVINSQDIEFVLKCMTLEETSCIVDTTKLSVLNNLGLTEDKVDELFNKLVYEVNSQNNQPTLDDTIENKFKVFTEKWLKLEKEREKENEKKKRFLTKIKGRNFLCHLARLEIDSYTAEYCAKIVRQTIFFKHGLAELYAFLKSNKQIFQVETELNTMLGLSKVFSLGNSACKLDNLPNRPICISLNLALDKQEKLVEAFSSTKENNILIIECKTTHNGANAFYKKLLEIVKHNKSKKIIFITQLGKNDLNKIFGNDLSENYEFNCNFNDLSDDSQKKILKTNILFQGKEVKLESIVDKDLIDGEVLSKLINDEKIEIGEPLQDLDINYYIDRTLIRYNLTTNKWDKFQPTKLTDINDRIVIVAAPAGMGKSTILSHLARNTNESNLLLWIVKINLNNYTNLLEKFNFIDVDTVLNFLVKIMNINSKLENKLLKHYLIEKGNIALLFDGFDEISPYYKKTVVKLLHILKTTKVEKLWITTRLHLKQELENEFNTLSFELNQFSRDDQRTFLRKFWSQSDNNKVDSYIDKLLDVMSTSIKDMTFELVSIPLQTRMLAEAYEDNFKTYLESNIMPQFNGTFDLIDLYECFINKKFKIFFEDKMKANLSNQAAKESLLGNQKLIKNQHKLLAINALYPGKLNNALFDIGYPNEQLLRVGLINKLDNNEAQFIHRTFAEYFIALWLSDTDNLINADVQALLIAVLGTYKRYGNEVILNFLNKILIGKIEIQTAVINRDEDKVRSLLQTNKNTINSTDKANRTVLHLAVIYGYEDIIKVLLEHNANVNCYDKGFNWSPLVYAAQMERWDIAKLLIDKGACSQDLQKVRNDLQEKKYRRKNKETLLHFSISYADIGTIKCITKKCTYVNIKDNDGNTALHLAAQHGYNDVVVALLQKGAIYNPTNNLQLTPLEVAKYYEETKPTFHLIEQSFTVLTETTNDSSRSTLLTNLLEQGVTIQASNRICQNILHVAAEYGYCDVVQTLITHVRNHHPDILIQYVNTEDKDGNTALHYAAREGNVDIIRYLLDNNADVNTKDIHNRTPLHYAAKGGHYDVVQTLITHVRNHHPDILIQYINTEDEEGNTPLHYAAMCGKVDIVRYLLDNNADVNTKDIYNMTPLHVAAEHGYNDVVQTLITHVRNHHPDILIQYVNTKDINGNTALHYAATYGKVDSVIYLLDNNADVNTKNVYNMTPLHVAAERGYNDVVETLITHVRNHHPDILIQYVNTKNEDGNTALDLIFKPIQYYPWEEIKLNGHVVKLLINEGAYFNKKKVLSSAKIKSLQDTDPALYQDIIDAINNRTLSNPNIS